MSDEIISKIIINEIFIETISESLAQKQNLKHIYSQSIFIGDKLVYYIQNSCQVNKILVENPTRKRAST